jgi:hypothetical protein
MSRTFVITATVVVDDDEVSEEVLQNDSRDRLEGGFEGLDLDSCPEYSVAVNTISVSEI